MKSGVLKTKLKTLTLKLYDHLKNCEICDLKKLTCEVCHTGVVFYEFEIEIAGEC